MPRHKNALRKLAELYDHIGDAGDGDNIVAVYRSYLDEASREGATLVYALALFQSAMDEIACTTLEQDMKDDHLRFLQETREKFASASLTSKAGNLKGVVSPDATRQMLRLLADLVQSAGGKEALEIDRHELVSSTNDLIAHVRKSELPDYAKGALAIKLNAIVSIANFSATFPEDEIRLRIKAVIADYLTELDAYDKPYRSTTEKVVSWAKKYSMGAAFTMGLIADGSAVAGLLMPPGE